MGFLPEGPSIPRVATKMTDHQGNIVGNITSGSFSPSLNRPVAMGYIESKHVSSMENIKLLIRKNTVDAQIVKLPFLSHRKQLIKKGNNNGY